MPGSLIVSLLVFTTLVAFPALSSGQEIVDIIFARDVSNREPVAPFQPGTYCSNKSQPSGQVPVINSQEDRKVYLWNRIKSATGDVLRHRWYKDGMEVATVEQNLGVSPGYRTWSSKIIDPNFHIGKWSVEVTTASDPSKVLCVAHFEVQ
jgi:hypothetical protein